MFNSYRRNLIGALAMILILVIALCTSVICICSFDRTISLNKNNNGGEYLGYTFKDDSLTLDIPSGADESDVTWYYLTEETGVNEITDGAYEGCSAFLAVLDERKSSGITLHEYAKAVTDAGSGHYAAPNAFDMENLPFEVVMNAKEITKEEDITVWFNGKPLCNEEVLLKTIKGERKVTTDKNGTIKFSSLKEIPNGLTVSYSDGSEKYVFYLIAQHSEMSWYGFRKGMVPVFLMLAVSFFGIVVVLIIRRFVFGGKNRYDVSAFATRNNRKDTFWRIRDIVHIVSFILIFFGSYFFGFKVSNSDIPVFACGWNTDQFIQCGSCYYISHFSYWMSDPKDSVEMFKGFMDQMNWSIKDFMLWGTGWFVGMLAITFLFGRLLCGFICPMGFIQDKLCDLRQALHIREIKISEKGYKVLKVIQAEMVIIFVGLGFLGIDYCHFCPAAIATSPAFAGFRINVYTSLITASLAVIGSFFKDRFFCNICPLGFIIGLCHKICPVKIRKSGTACTECGACYDACPVGIKSIYTEHEKEDLTCRDCLMCGKCVNQCPCSGALYITVFGRKIYESSAEKFLKRQIRKKK